MWFACNNDVVCNIITLIERVPNVCMQYTIYFAVAAACGLLARLSEGIDQFIIKSLNHLLGFG